MNCLFAHSVFSSPYVVHNSIFKDKVIQNDYEEKGWSVYKIWRDHSVKNWAYRSVKKLLNSFKDSGTMNRKEGSG